MTAEPPNQSGAILLVAAKSLQSYVLGSDKLREMVGATQLIEDFCSKENADAVLAAMGISDGEVLTGAAGQITIRFAREDSARRAAALWPWFSSRLAPGLEMHVGVATLSGGYKGALDACQKQIALSRNRPPASLPAAAPPHRRNPRSGSVAVGEAQEPDGKVLVDAAGQAKRDRREVRDAAVFRRFGVNEGTLSAQSFEEITEGGGGERSYLAIVHADGNGFGQLLMEIGRKLDSPQGTPHDTVTVFQTLSRLIRETGESAVEAAVGSLMPRIEAEWQETEAEAANRGRPAPKRIVPWLPIVQAGDDLTLVIRADLAFEFLEAYLRSFESVSAAMLAGFRQKHQGLTNIESLTAGGSIIYCKTQHPFSEAYALCESLAKARAKGGAVRENGDPEKPARSAIALHRISASTSANTFSDLRRAELLSSDGAQPELELIAAPWFLDDAAGPFSVSRLRALTEALRAFPAGSRRQILAELRTSRDQALARLKRMIDIRGRTDSRKAKDEIAALEEALKDLHGDSKALWRPIDGAGAGVRKPLLASAVPDALTLLEMTRESSAD